MGAQVSMPQPSLRFQSSLQPKLSIELSNQDEFLMTEIEVSSLYPDGQSRERDIQLGDRDSEATSYRNIDIFEALNGNYPPGIIDSMIRWL